MPIIPCPITLRSCLPCNDFPVANLSAEDPDKDVFIGFFDFRGNPPLGYSYFQLACKTICFSEVSQLEADLCAERQAKECVWNEWRVPQPPIDPNTGEPQTPPFGPPQPPQIFLNSQQSCTKTCPDGTTFGAVIQSGQVAALSQLEADRIAESLACNLARTQRICISTAAALTGACEETEYSLQLKASGGTPWIISTDDLLFAPFCASLGDRFPYAWTVIDGALPSGISLGECSGVLSGIPNSAGTYTFTIRATDSIGSFQTKQFTLVVAEITTASPLPDGSIGSNYTQNLSVSPAHDQETEFWTIAAGSLPPGITMSTAGVLSGTPTLSGTYMFTPHVVFSLNGANVTCEKQFTLEIESVPLPYLYWKLDGDYTDSVESIALVPTLPITTFVAGIIGSGVRYPPSLNSSLDVRCDDPFLTYIAGESLSFTIWMKWAGVFDANDQFVIDWAKSAGADEIDLTLRFNQTSMILDLNNDIDFAFESTAFVPVVGNWYFFAVTYDYTTGIARVYVNGVLTLTSTTPVQFFTALTDNRIRNLQSGAIGGSAMDVVVDEIGWYKSQLDQSAIDFLYNSGAGNRPSGI